MRLPISPFRLDPLEPIYGQLAVGISSDMSSSDVRDILTTVGTCRTFRGFTKHWIRCNLIFPVLPFLNQSLPEQCRNVSVAVGAPLTAAEMGESL